MKKKPLIIDNFGVGRFQHKLLSEAKYDDHGKFVQGMLVEGIFQRANAINQNGRKYPKSILLRESENYLKDYINQKRSYGELDHPDSSIVSMQTASHWVTKLWWDKNDLYGQIELLDTPCGRIVETVLKRGLTIGISSRGLGSVKQLKEDEDTVEVQDDFEIVAWDFVSNPSTQGAFLKPVKESLHEGYTKNSKGIYVPDYKFGRVNQLITDILLEF